jgi:type IX secretion system PorP/SprF family membrane protein
MKKIISSLSLVLFAFVANAQQQPLFSQYMLNPFVINPSMAGTFGQTELKTVIRSQWTDFTGQPRVKTFSLNGAVNGGKMGLGTYVFTDVIGPASKTGVNGSYAYHIKTAKNATLSFGLSGMFYLYKLNTDSLSFDIRGNTDNVVSKGNYRAFAPNAGFGMYYKAEKYYAGISIPELMPVKITSTADFFLVQQKQHYFLNGGYFLKASDAVTLIPSVMMKYVQGAPLQIDANVNVDIKKMVTLGASYRTGDAIVFMISFGYKDILQLGYAYDLTMSPLKQYVGMSHEIMLCYKFKKKAPEQPKEGGDGEDKKEEQPKQEEPK